MTTRKQKILLYDNKKDCCGCMACVNICPKSAISIKKDEIGFLYPEIDYDVCIGCGQCKKVCNFQNKNEENNVIAAYSGVCSDKAMLLKSASGGMFAVLANDILKNNGVVFGCSMEYENEMLYPRHIAVSDEKQLYKLQGSKYVQSDLGDSYKKVRELLFKGKRVLFSGTPCQVAGLYGFLGEKNIDNLITIDIICHGVPSIDFFQSYIKFYEYKKKLKVENFKFRDKKWGWGLTGSVTLKNKRGTLKTKPIYSRLSSYYKLFLDADVYKESCYSCKYASEHRPADITLGDFWGFEREHPESLVENGGEMCSKYGISCILVNTAKGKRMIENIGSFAYVKESSFTKISNKNGQLKQPSGEGINRDIVLRLYQQGYEAVDRWYNKKLGIKKYAYIIAYKMPYELMRRIKRLARKIRG